MEHVLPMLYLDYNDGFYCLSLMSSAELLNTVDQFAALRNSSINLINLSEMLIRTLHLHLKVEKKREDIKIQIPIHQILPQLI